MTRGLLASLAAIPVLLALSCSGNEDSAPVVPVATSRATPTTTPTPASPTQGAAATAVATTSATPYPTTTTAPSATVTATTTPVPTATPLPTLSTLTVTGPLLVFSEVLDVDRSRPPFGETDTRRVHVYDLSADRYWVAFDYQHTLPSSGLERSAVQVAGESLIVWTEDEVRRVSLEGETERVLFEYDHIYWLEVSPDGTKVAIGANPFGGTGNAAVLVVDIATGQELLDSGRHFDRIFVRSSEGLRQRWHGDGTALLVEAALLVEERRRGLLRLDGAFDVLPEDWHVSPDLRYALRVGEEIGTLSLNRHNTRSVWESLDVLDVETGDVLWTVQAQDGGGLYQHLEVDGDSWWGPGLKKEPTWEDRRHVFFNELAPESDWRVGHQPSLGVLKALDVATGEVHPLTAEVEGLLRGRAWSTCGRSRPTLPPVCRIQYDGRTIREGAGGWTQFLGVVEPVGDIEFRGIMPLSVAVEREPPAPPPREEMVGPLLLYEVERPHPTTPRLAIAYDEGTGRSWTLHRRTRDRNCSPQAADGGFATCSGSDLLYIAVDGDLKTLVRSVSYSGFGVAPDGTRVAVEPNNDVLVLEIPSGDEILRVESEDIYEALRLPGQGQHALAPWGAGAWSVDGTALLVYIIGGHYPAPGAIVTLDGEVIPLPRRCNGTARTSRPMPAT